MLNKIKKGLSFCLAAPGTYDGTWTEHCFKCPYYNYSYCKQELLKDCQTYILNIDNIKKSMLQYAADAVEREFDSDKSACRVSNCNKPDSIGCGNRICIDENIELEKKKIEDIFNGKQ